MCHPRLDRIKELRGALKLPDHGSLLYFLDELLDIAEDLETRLRYLEKTHEETD